MKNKNHGVNNNSLKISNKSSKYSLSSKIYNLMSMMEQETRWWERNWIQLYSGKTQSSKKRLESKNWTMLLHQLIKIFK